MFSYLILNTLIIHSLFSLITVLLMCYTKLSTERILIASKIALNIDIS